MEKRLEKIETLLLFQEKTIEDLNEVIIEQQEQINHLELQYKILKEKVIKNSIVMEQKDEIPPPHW